MIDYIGLLNDLLRYVLGSFACLAVIWIGVWTFSFWKSNKQHKELVARLHRIETQLNDKFKVT